MPIDFFRSSFVQRTKIGALDEHGIERDPTKPGYVHPSKKFGISSVTSAPASVEKFIAPQISDCWTVDRGGGYQPDLLSQGFRELYDMQGYERVGLEDLAGIPNNSAARVAALRTKINKNKSAAVKRYRGFEQSSLDGMRLMALKVIDIYKDPSKAPALAESLGIPVAKVRADALAILKIANDNTGGLAGYVLQRMYEQFGPELLRLTQNAVASVVGATGSSVKAFSETISSVVPVLSAAFKVASDLYAADVEAKEESKRLICQSGFDKISYFMEHAATAKMALNWHIGSLQLDEIGCDQVTGADRDGGGWGYGRNLSIAIDMTSKNTLYQLGPKVGAEDYYYGSKRYGNGLPFEDQYYISRWWGLALMLWSDPEVSAIMSTMADDFWGGGLASDEQVMCVAAPIARSYSIDVDAFARRLWDKSAGWRSRPDLFWKVQMSGCGDRMIVDNARQIQFAVLARDAFSLVDDQAEYGGPSDSGYTGAIEFVTSPTVLTGAAASAAALVLIPGIGWIAAGPLLLASLAKVLSR